MCNPGILAVAAAAVTATGQVVSGVQAQRQGQYEAAVANQNTQLVRQQQADAQTRDVQQRQQLDRKYSQLEGTQQAAFAANGIDASFGSAAQVANDTATLRNEDASNLYSNQNSEMRGFDISAANYQSQAQAARMRGNSALTGAIFGAGSTILGGAQQYSSFRQQYGMYSNPFGKKSTYGIPNAGNIY